LVSSEKKRTFAADLCRAGSKKKVTGWPRPTVETRLIQIKMYAIVEINGQQFKVEAGKKLFVQHMQEAENGQTVEFEKVLLVDNDGAITVGAPTVEGAKVTAKVETALVKGEKVLVFHKKRRKGYRKLNGHRQQFTELTINEIIA
jgi:large subunit ribosomal protein L21